MIYFMRDRTGDDTVCNNKNWYQNTISKDIKRLQDTKHTRKNIHVHWLKISRKLKHVGRFGLMWHRQLAVHLCGSCLLTLCWIEKNVTENGWRSSSCHLRVIFPCLPVITPILPLSQSHLKSLKFKPSPQKKIFPKLWKLIWKTFTKNFSK